jgi:hypothetical protein
MPLSGFFLKKKPPSKDLVRHMNWRTALQWDDARLAKMNLKLAVQMILGFARRSRHKVSCAWVLLGVALAAYSQAPRPGIRFREIAHEAGLNTSPHTSPDKHYLVEMMGGGVALFDCDNYGMLDILTVNDSTVDRYLRGGERMVTLYHQDSKLRFFDITVQSGLTTRG